MFKSLFAVLLFVGALAGLGSSSPAARTPQCITVQVSTAKVADIPKLLADAACFEALADAATTAKLRKSYLQSARLRSNKARELQATIPPPPPVVLPPPPPPTSENGLPGLPIIPSNFDINSELGPAWGTGEIPPSMVPDVVGAFRFVCGPGHLSYDDPIVYPSQPGKSHLHQFFGNTLANAFSTYETLRKTGMSTCMSPLNRSGYWIPAMMNGKGQVVRPDYVSIYYKRRPASDPVCDWTRSPIGQGKACVDIPRGLKYVFGFNTLNMTSPGFGWAGPIWFNCDGPTAIASGHFVDIVEAAKNCPTGNHLLAVIVAPDCWNGKDLDSPDHRSHMAYQYNTGQGYFRCPSTHPYVIPAFQLGAAYTVDDDLDKSGVWDGSKPTWHLSSDVMAGMPMMRPGTTFHADWFGAWDDVVLKIWHDNCIDKMLSCAGGVLGNGQQMKVFTGFSWEVNPRVVATPPRP